MFSFPFKLKNTLLRDKEFHYITLLFTKLSLINIMRYINEKNGKEKKKKKKLGRDIIEKSTSINMSLILKNDIYVF